MNPRLLFSRRKFLHALWATPIAMTGHALGIEPGWLKVRKFELPDNRGIRLAHITDIHFKGDSDYLRRVVAAINGEKPAFVCFTGDLIEEEEHLDAALEILSGIEAPLYGVPGNHDFWADVNFDLCAAAFEKQGGKWLMDQEVFLPNHKIRIFGMSSARHSAFEPQQGEKSVLLTHYPLGVDNYPATQFDLVLAGHSHGGQVRLPGYGALITPSGVGKYDLGWFETPAGPLYVNPGIGYFYADVRFCCRPEVTLITI